MLGPDVAAIRYGAYVLSGGAVTVTSKMDGSLVTETETNPPCAVHCAAVMGFPSFPATQYAPLEPSRFPPPLGTRSLAIGCLAPVADPLIETAARLFALRLR